VIVAHAWTAQNERREKKKIENQRKERTSFLHHRQTEKNEDIYVFNEIRTRDPACRRLHFNVTGLQKQCEKKVMLDVTLTWLEVPREFTTIRMTSPDDISKYCKVKR
jgi:hypothetical protein